ncbi:putative mRNA-capping enzyme [Bienertia sinuspersici]
MPSSLTPEFYETLSSPWQNTIICRVVGKSFSSTFLLDSLKKTLGDIRKNYLAKPGKGLLLPFLQMGFLQQNSQRRTRPWSPGFKPSSALISKVPVWATLPELPMEFHNLGPLRKIGDCLGKFIKADFRKDLNHLRYAKILVLMDLSEQIKTGLWIGSLFQELLWEEIPKFCPTCRVIGHVCPQMSNPIPEELKGDERESLQGSLEGQSEKRSLEKEKENTQISSSQNWILVTKKKNSQKNS